MEKKNESNSKDRNHHRRDVHPRDCGGSRCIVAAARPFRRGLPQPVRRHDEPGCRGSASLSRRSLSLRRHRRRDVSGAEGARCGSGHRLGGLPDHRGDLLPGRPGLFAPVVDARPAVGFGDGDRSCLAAGHGRSVGEPARPRGDHRRVRLLPGGVHVLHPLLPIAAHSPLAVGIRHRRDRPDADGMRAVVVQRQSHHQLHSASCPHRIAGDGAGGLADRQGIQSGDCRRRNGDSRQDAAHERGVVGSGGAGNRRPSSAGIESRSTIALARAIVAQNRSRRRPAGSVLHVVGSGGIDAPYIGPAGRPREQGVRKDRMSETEDAVAELERGVHAALETYSNVHRGSGHHSMVSTRSYEEARDAVQEYLGLRKDRYVTIFCTPRRADQLAARLKPGSFRSVSSREIGLPLGLRALAIERRALPRGIPFQTGGGTARLVSPGWVIWADAPDRFEAGTPAIVNVIAFAKALRLIQQYGADAFEGEDAVASPAAGILYRDALEPYTGRELLSELRKTLIGRGFRVPTTDGAKPYTNLDNGASTPTFEPVWDAVRRTWRQSAPVQQEIVREVKAICADFLGAPLADYEVIFTSNTTEAINLAAESLHNESEPGIETAVVNTLLEHNSNELPWRTTPGFSLIRMPVDAEGFLDHKELERVLSEYNRQGRHGNVRIKLVAVSGASNVLGSFNDLAEIGRIAHAYGARLLVDGAQLVAHRKVAMAECGIDYLAFSAHKAYAPFGTGVLVVRRGLLHFSAGEMTTIRSSGEENAGGIAALGKALLLLQRIGMDTIQEEEQALTAHALRGLATIPGIEILGIKDPESPRFARKGGVIVFDLKEMMADRVAKELSERGGIGVRSGCHCAHMLVKHLLHVSPSLERFQRVMLSLLPRVALPGVTRVSLGIENTETDIDVLVATLAKIARQQKVGTGAPLVSVVNDNKPEATKRA